MNDKHDQIDKYLLNEMSSAEKQNFEIEMRNNKELQGQINITEKAIQAIHYAENAALKRRLQKLETQLDDEKIKSSSHTNATIKPLRKFQWIKYAVAAMIILALSWWLIQPSNMEGDKLAANYFKPYPNYAVNLTRTSTDDIEQEAYLAYEEGQYDEAINLMRDLEATPVNRFYLAQSYFAAENYTEASNLFKELSLLPDFKLRQESEYYSALALLALNNNQQAAVILKSISQDPNHNMHKEAKALLDEVNN